MKLNNGKTRRNLVIALTAWNAFFGKVNFSSAEETGAPVAFTL